VPKKTLSELLSTEVQDAYFDYDKSDIRDDAGHADPRCRGAQQIFTEIPDAVVQLEGNCDESLISE